MPPPRIPTGLLARFSKMRLVPLTPKPSLFSAPPIVSASPAVQPARHFSSSHPRLHWLSPRTPATRKSNKGRCHVPTGGSMRGTTVVWGDYGLRMRDHDRRISAHQLRIAEDTIKKRLRGQKFRLYHRVSANIGVYTSGNDVRMGKGKGTFDRWVARVPVSRIVLEIKGELHEQVVRDTFRLVANKLPGLYEFVKKGDPPVMGLTKVGLNGNTEEYLRRPRKQLEALPEAPPSASPSTSQVTNSPP